VTEPQSFELIERMRKLFPAWEAWVHNRHDKPDKEFEGYAQAIKPLPFDCVADAMGRMHAAKELPKFKRMVPLLKHEGDLVRCSKAAQKTADEAATSDAERRGRPATAKQGSSRWACIEFEQLSDEAKRLFPDDEGCVDGYGERTPRDAWWSDAAAAVWLEFELYKKGGAHVG